MLILVVMVAAFTIAFAAVVVLFVAQRQMQRRRAEVLAKLLGVSARNLQDAVRMVRSRGGMLTEADLKTVNARLRVQHDEGSEPVLVVLVLPWWNWLRPGFMQRLRAQLGMQLPVGVAYTLKASLW